MTRCSGRMGPIAFARLGWQHYRGQPNLAKKLVWAIAGAPDMHTRIRNAHVCNVIERLHLGQSLRVLDMGCGRGIALMYLATRHPGWQLTGVDCDREMVLSLRKTASPIAAGTVMVEEEDLASYQSPCKFDLILSIDALEHVTDDRALLRRARGWLRDGGYLVIHVPIRRSLQRRVVRAFHKHSVTGHVREEYEPLQLRQLVQGVGFRVIEVGRTFGPAGEFAFELNMLAWHRWSLRQVIALLTLPVTLPLAYIDTLGYHTNGNSILLVATTDSSEDPSQGVAVSSEPEQFSSGLD